MEETHKMIYELSLVISKTDHKMILNMKDSKIGQNMIKHQWEEVYEAILSKKKELREKKRNEAWILKKENLIGRDESSYHELEKEFQEMGIHIWRMMGGGQLGDRSTQRCVVIPAEGLTFLGDCLKTFKANFMEKYLEPEPEPESHQNTDRDQGD